LVPAIGYLLDRSRAALPRQADSASPWPSDVAGWMMDDVIEAGSTYVALGSSFAAGPGIAPQVDKPARRSNRNYPHQVAEALSLHLVDVTCSGATTANILAEPQRARRTTMRPQIQAVTPDTRLVTITIGGNDLGYIGALVRGSLLGTVSRVVRVMSDRLADRIRDRVDHTVTPAQVATVTASLAEVVTAVRERAPQARVVLVDYLTVLGDDSREGARMPLPPEQVRQVVTTAHQLAEAFAQAAALSGADLVEASAAGTAHGVGSAEPWVTGFEFGGKVPYHPNLAGMTAVADLVVRKVSDS
jgi:lysophospholipase L1-like esterase